GDRRTDGQYKPLVGSLAKSPPPHGHPAVFKKGERGEGEKQDLHLPSHLPAGREAGSAPRLLGSPSPLQNGTEQALSGNGDGSR
uniref:Uncharacterized protein n=1 Tax=Aquila chrysaetos chrysaetos TaxID=223781 RepID=A0A663DS65_AQUCH